MKIHYLDGSQRQEDIFNYIRKFIHDRGYSPTLDEIKDAVGLQSKSSVSDYVKALIKAGRLTGGTGIARSLRPVEPPIVIQVERIDCEEYVVFEKNNPDVRKYGATQMESLGRFMVSLTRTERIPVVIEYLEDKKC